MSQSYKLQTDTFLSSIDLTEIFRMTFSFYDKTVTWILKDSKTLSYTQFCGFLLRPPQETFKTVLKNLTEDDGVSISDGFRGFTPSRGTTPIRGLTPTLARDTTSPLAGMD